MEFVQHHLQNWKPDSFQTKVTTKRLSTVEIQPGRSNSTTQLRVWIVRMLNYSFKATVFTQVLSLSLKQSSWGFLRQTDTILRSVAGQHLVGQWLISSSFSPEVSLPVRSTVESVCNSVSRQVSHSREIKSFLILKIFSLLSTCNLRLLTSQSFHLSVSLCWFFFCPLPGPAVLHAELPGAFADMRQEVSAELAYNPHEEWMKSHKLVVTSWNLIVSVLYTSLNLSTLHLAGGKRQTELYWSLK